MRFDVPFLPEPEYAAFLRGCAARLDSVHFSLYSDDAQDARFKPRGYSLEDIIPGLSGLVGVGKYVLINSRFHPPELYGDAGRLRGVAGKLERLLDAGALTGVVYADHYYLQALSDACGGLASRLEAVPSVNAMIDSFERAASALDYIAATRFKPPSRIILDRSLNRDLKRLERVSSRIRKAWPEMEIVLLANEGCLRNCPFKFAHDAHISLAGMPFGREAGFAVNRDKGCTRYFFEDPGRIFASPFIRPEDAALYADLVDTLKLCGRTRGGRVMRDIISAYVDGAYSGNLLAVLDSLEVLSGRIVIDNASLPQDFGKRAATCGGLCATCAYCGDLARGLARLIDPAPDLLPPEPAPPRK